MNRVVDVLFDWVTLRIRGFSNDPDRLINWFLGLNADLFVESSGFNGYPLSKEFKNIRVGYFYDHQLCDDQSVKMGMCVSMSGKGCRYFEHNSVLAAQECFKDCQGLPNPAFSALFQLVSLNQDNISCTRVDIACDDHKGLLDIALIGDMIDDDLVRSRVKNTTSVVARSGKDRIGQTHYIGSRTSENFVRFYDKAAEQFEQGSEGFRDHWVRCETVLKGEYANNFVNLFVNSDNIGDLIARILNDKLAFINRDDSNISRCSVCEWWLNFVDTLAAVHLVTRGEECHTIDEKLSWFEHQVAPVFAVLCDTYVNEKDFLRYIKELGRQRFKKNHAAMIKQNQGLHFERKLPYVSRDSINV